MEHNENNPSWSSLMEASRFAFKRDLNPNLAQLEPSLSPFTQLTWTQLNWKTMLVWIVWRLHLFSPALFLYWNAIEWFFLYAFYTKIEYHLRQSVFNSGSSKKKSENLHYFTHGSAWENFAIETNHKKKKWHVFNKQTTLERVQKRNKKKKTEQMRLPTLGPTNHHLEKLRKTK